MIKKLILSLGLVATLSFGAGLDDFDQKFMKAKLTKKDFRYVIFDKDDYCTSLHENKLDDYLYGLVQTDAYRIIDTYSSRELGKVTVTNTKRKGYLQTETFFSDLSICKMFLLEKRGKR